MNGSSTKTFAVDRAVAAHHSRQAELAAGARLERRAQTHCNEALALLQLLRGIYREEPKERDANGSELIAAEVAVSVRSLSGREIAALLFIVALVLGAVVAGICDLGTFV